MERYICIHGHFYQPPRENPWLEAIEFQGSAYPYHDWNERITAECYAPNSASRIMNGDGRIVKIVNNYAKTSFNMGPTLLAWMEAKAPDVYRAILAADKESREHFSGHGSALAQAYNHAIMPLCSPRDKHTQVVWGIKDFEHRFGRRPEGMWLPETAVDLETLDLLAQHGTRFTVLAPRQAKQVRKAGSRTWHDVSGGRVDPTTPYLQRLPSGRTIAIFFYDGPISQGVAFEGLLKRGEDLAGRLLSAFSDQRPWPQLVNIATDGETYGHHHRFGDMALAYATNFIESKQDARLTNYGEFLEKHPPTHEVEVFENTSWSCVHGVERWRDDCGCNTGARSGWNQEWRRPLREALDWLRDTIAPAYERQASQLFKAPWAARDGYIAVVLDRSQESLDRFFKEHAVQPLSQEERVTALKLLELQRHAMLMYTSCGWFFDELSRIETVQVIQYAGRAIQLAQELFDDDRIEEGFLDILGRAKSNIRENRDGRTVYERFVKPAVVDWERIGAHYAVSSLFKPPQQRETVYSYAAELEDYQTFESGRTKLVVGRVRLTSIVTTESAVLTFGFLHLGDHNVNGGVRRYRGPDVHEPMLQEFQEAFSRADFPEIIRLMDRHFGESTYSLRSLFRDEQRMALDQILAATLSNAEAVYRQVYEHEAPMMRFLIDLGSPLPRAFAISAEFFINTDLRHALSAYPLDLDRIRARIEEAAALRIDLDVAGLGYVLTHTLERLTADFAAGPEDVSRLEQLVGAVALARSSPLEVNLWGPQNTYYAMLQTVYPQVQVKANQGDEAAQAWTGHFKSLGEQLLIHVD
jgi:alpha-amylase/alpha-mannosidase (GH57 family)